MTHGSRAESVESFKLKTYAKIFSLTRQAIINDDLGAFADSASAFGRGAAQTEALTSHALGMRRGVQHLALKIIDRLS